MIGGITRLVWGSVARFVWFVRASFCLMCLVVFCCFCVTPRCAGALLSFRLPQTTSGKNKTNDNKHQVTDVRFAKLGKQGGEREKRRLRKLHRLKGHLEHTATTLESKHLDLMHIVTAI